LFDDRPTQALGAAQAKPARSRSVRFTREQEETIERWAERHGLGFTAAVHALIKRGLESDPVI
jgi:hypothetical protein